MKAISSTKVQEIAREYYGLSIQATALAGDEDANFKLQDTAGKNYLLKISNAESELDLLNFQNEILKHLQKITLEITLPAVISNLKGKDISTVSIDGENYFVRMLSWVPGRLWSAINPKTANLRYSLGKAAGSLTQSLEGFTHPEATRSFDWNLAEALWTQNQLHLFTSEKKQRIETFQQQFVALQPVYKTLPKAIVHNDINDNNILVSKHLKDPIIEGLIDFGDAVHTQTVNDIAIVMAYACMHVPDPLEAALDVLSGYNEYYRFSEKELHCLYTLVAMRWVTTVTKAALRRSENSENSYHTVSEKPAWDALEKWFAISSEFAEYCFRNACGFDAHPNEKSFKDWAQKNTFTFAELFPKEGKEDIYLLDLKLSSKWIGSRHEFNNLELFEYKINQLQKENPTKLIADGYLEPRPIYTSTNYDKEGNNGPESRAVHLGIDFWLPSGTPVHTIFDAEVITAINDAGYKEYGGLIILKHNEENIEFFTLYGHLSAASPSRFEVGDTLKKGDCIGYLGTPVENGEWSPHLHFQLMLSMLNYKIDFPGVTYPKQVSVWKSICPDPNLLFKNKNLVTQYDSPIDDILHFRKKHLGRSLSVSYQEPLHIVRGDGVYLLDNFGRKYLDTVNNVAHVGHEHPKIVAAGQQQMALLNTNTRYLNEEITKYGEALLAKLPKELSVLHFVNSGSEANELAIRMAKTVTNRSEMLAIEIGYHGNTNAVIEVSSYKFDGKGGKGKPKNTHILPMPDSFRGLHLGEASGEEYAAYALEIIQDLKLKDREIAAFIGEPIISCGGQIVPPKDYFKQVYQYVRDAGGLCIADEVQTGFGRTGKHFWAFELHEVVPDIVTMGKPIGNGHPLAAVACTQEVADAFANGMEFFNTFGGNPVSCAIGRAVLEVIAEEKLQENALEIGTFLKEGLKYLQQNFSIIGDVRGEGFFLGIELVDSNRKPLAEQATYLANRMKEQHILMSTDGPDHNVLKIKPPMVFSKTNAEELLARLDRVLQEDFLVFN